jgi:hypothetical protein
VRFKSAYEVNGNKLNLYLGRNPGFLRPPKANEVVPTSFRRLLKDDDDFSIAAECIFEKSNRQLVTSVTISHGRSAFYHRKCGWDPILWNLSMSKPDQLLSRLYGTRSQPPFCHSRTPRACKINIILARHNASEVSHRHDLISVVTPSVQILETQMLQLQSTLDKFRRDQSKQGLKSKVKNAAKHAVYPLKTHMDEVFNDTKSVDEEYLLGLKEMGVVI